mmetsp:Transcript_40985/g.93434  ORF Transcript_40985/g.93434 Transcript_40985/m.93434 type:complete len:245 (-) Transcript_40985:250-984(-)
MTSISLCASTRCCSGESSITQASDLFAIPSSMNASLSRSHPRIRKSVPALKSSGPASFATPGACPDEICLICASWASIAGFFWNSRDVVATCWLRFWKVAPAAPSCFPGYDLIWLTGDEATSSVGSSLGSRMQRAYAMSAHPSSCPTECFDSTDHCLINPSSPVEKISWPRVAMACTYTALPLRTRSGTHNVAVAGAKGDDDIAFLALPVGEADSPLSPTPSKGEGPGEPLSDLWELAGDLRCS